MFKDLSCGFHENWQIFYRDVSKISQYFGYAQLYVCRLNIDI